MHKKINIKGKIDNYIVTSFNIDLTKKYDVEYIKARDLVTANRIDLIAKIKYIEAIDKGYNTNFFEDLYRETIAAFSDDTYKEPGNKEKNSFKKYIKVFNELINEIKINGFDIDKSIIPVGKNNTIMDGAHRVSIAAYFDLEIPIVRFDQVEIKYDADFFKMKQMNLEYINYLIFEFCKLKNNIYAVCLWQKCSFDDVSNSIKKIKENFNVVYNYKINLNYNGLKNLMIQIYNKHDWVGSYKNHHKGVLTKVDNCYSENKEINIILVEANNIDDILKLKNNIREKVNIGNHSIHSTDNIEETLQLLSLTINENSVYGLNNYDPDKYYQFNIMFEKLKETIKKNNIPIDDLVVDSSSIMALFGIRENEDIDIIISEKYIDLFDEIGLDNHNNQISFYNNSIDDLLYNPSNYFIYNEIKFLTLDNLLIMKKNRNEQKDKEDVILINNTLFSNKKSKNFKILLNKKIRKLKRKTKKYFIDFFKKIGCFEMCRRLYKKWKRKEQNE